MSTYTLCFGCLDPISIPEALKSVMWQDSDGAFYLNIRYNERTDCEEYSRAFDCLEDMTVEEMLRSIVVEDDCGQCAINVLANICETCSEIEEEPPL